MKHFISLFADNKISKRRVHVSLVENEKREKNNLGDIY